MLIDTHAHLDFCLEDGNTKLESVLKRARDNGVERIIAIGYDLDSCQIVVRLARSHPEISAVIGIHPHEVKVFSSATLGELRRLAGEEKVMAIGEIGLDYYRNYSPSDKQQFAFRKQINLAKELRLPVVIHCREAHPEVLKILAEEEAKDVVFHCFSGGKTMAEECFKRGYFISVAGPITFPNAQKLREVIADIPLERLLLETDCPYLAPHPYRGKPNEPSYLPLIARAVAETKGVSFEELAEVTSQNALKFFRIEARMT